MVWRIDVTSEETGILLRDADDAVVAEVWPQPREEGPDQPIWEDEIAVAYARLIQAAPELEALAKAICKEASPHIAAGGLPSDLCAQLQRLAAFMSRYERHLL